MEQKIQFDWHVGRLENLSQTSLRFFWLPSNRDRGFTKKDIRRIVLVLLMMILVAFSSGLIWLGITLILLPFITILYAGLIQHWRYQDVLNKKYNYSWLLMNHIVEKILIEKGLPFDRKIGKRQIRFSIDNKMEIQLVPCVHYLHRYNKQIRWMVDPRGDVTDVAILPISDENMPLIESISLKIDAAYDAILEAGHESNDE